MMTINKRDNTLDKLLYEYIKKQTTLIMTFSVIWYLMSLGDFSNGTSYE